MSTPKTLAEKVWAQHLVAKGENGEPDLIYIDLHLIHEVTSPQAFEGLRLAGRPVRRPDRTLATADHNVPTDGTPTVALIKDQLSRVQVQTLERNCEEFGIPLYSLGSERQGIVHVIGPELGVTQPGMTIVCGDSHTATHGAFGALAFGIGTSEVEHVLATQCLAQRKPKSMRINYAGELGFGFGSEWRKHGGQGIGLHALHLEIEIVHQLLHVGHVLHRLRVEVTDTLVDETVLALTTTDVTTACDEFKETYEATGHVDGRVSIEVVPTRIGWPRSRAARISLTMARNFSSAVR